MSKHRVRRRPDETPWAGRPWESKCMDPDCASDTYAHTWHLSWYTAMGRAWGHRRARHA